MKLQKFVELYQSYVYNTSGSIFYRHGVLNNITQSFYLKGAI